MTRNLRTNLVRRLVNFSLGAVFCLATAGTASAVNLVQEFYLPMPESQIYTANSAIIAGTGTTMASTFSITVTGNGTVIYYDQWEDGYETDLSNPTQPTTQIWGDGNDAHGIPPGFAHNPLGLPAGTIITLTNNVPLPRNPSTILYDARDRIAASKAIIISRAGWPIPTGPVFAGAVSVLSTIDYGTNYISPVGQNLTNVNLLKYVGLFVMAAQNNTALTIDPKGTGVGTTNLVLNQGESYLVNGGIMVGGRVTASKPVQADLLIGHVGASYASDWFTLYPASAWSSSYYTPVGSASKVTQPAYVYLYNPGNSPITINYNTKVGSGSFSVPATNGVYQFQMPVSSGASFTSAGGQNFYALCTVAANNSSDTSFNWGFTLVPQGALTTEADVGWAPGSADGTVDGSPVWVTALANTKLYVDYKGDHAGPLTDPNGNQYDTNFTVTALQSLKIFDPSKNQTGMRVYTVDGTLITAAWGEDADTAQPGNPYIDAGTTVLPFPTPLLKKSAVIVTDAPPAGLSVGDTVQYTVEVDNKGLLPLGNTVVIDAPSGNLTYVPNSTSFNSNNIPDNTSGQIFPLASPGYTIPIILSQGTSVFKYLARVNAAGVVSNSVDIGGTTIFTSTILMPPPTNGATVTLKFTDTNGVASPFYTVGANVYVTMTNAVGNTASNSVQSISVTVKDQTSGDLETIPLTETGTNTGVFRNIVGLPTSSISGLAQQDGVLNVNPGDTLSVSYTDPNFGDSASATAGISIPTPNKQLYLSLNGSTNGTQALNRIDPVAYAHGPVHPSIDIGSGGSGALAVLSTTAVTNGTGGTTISVTNVNVPVGSSEMLLVGVTFNPGSTVSGITYSGKSLTLAKGVGDGTYERAEVWELLNPPVGTTNLAITFASAATDITVGALVLSGVNQTTPISATSTNGGNSTTPTVTIASAAGNQVFNLIASRSATTATATGSGQVKYWSLPSTGGGITSMGAASLTPGANSVTNSWTTPSGTFWSSVAVSIQPAIGGGSGGPATNVTSFAQTPALALPFTLPAGGVVSVTNFITLTNGTLTSGAAVTATLQTNGVNFLTLANPVYTGAAGVTNLVWSAALSTNLTVPAGAVITYVISNGVPGTAFHVNYDSTNAPSEIVLPATTVIQINSLGVYDAPYPGGNLVNTPVAGSTVYVRANVSDPFGSYDITSLGLAVTGPSPGSSFTNVLTAANVVASDSSSKTYEYAWATGPATGGYNIAATAHEGTEGVTATAVAGITTTFLDLGTPSTTEFTSGANGPATNSYAASSLVSIRVTALDSITNSAVVQSIPAALTSSTGDSETLILIETGPGSGVYTNSIKSSSTVVGAPNDGTVYALVGSILTANYTDPNDPSFSSSALATIQAAPGVPGVSINKTIISPTGGQIGTNQPVTYNLQVFNTGSTTLTNVVVTDNFSSGRLIYSTASPAPSTTGAGVLTWNNLGNFAPGQNTNLTVTFITGTATGTTTNSATVNGGTATNSSSVTLLVNNAAVNVTKILLSPTNTPVAVGSNVVFRITVQNVGNTIINYLPLEDTFSGAYYQFVSSTITNNGSGAGSLLWTNLAAPTPLAVNGILTNDVTMKVVGQGSPANNTATVDFATDIFGNPVPVSASTIGVNTATASINGHVYDDTDQSGVYNPGDPGIAGVTLRLFTDPNGDGNPADGVLVQITTTDAGGYYEFLNLNVGHFVIVEDHLPGYDSTAPSSNQRSVNLATLSASTNNDFFDYQPSPSVYSTLSGQVWNDANGNGTNGVGETNLVNIEVDLYQDVNTNLQVDLGESLMGSTLTDNHGNYSFAGVTPGHYVIQVANPFGYYSTGDSQGRTDGQISFASTNGVVSTNNNFYIRPSPIAVNDTNSTGYFQPVTLYPLTNDISPNGDPLTLTNITSADGLVTFIPGATNLSFTPTHVGIATITYTIYDAHGGSSTATISVGVTPAPLTITASNVSKIYGQTFTFAGTAFMAVGLTNGDTVTSVSLSSLGATNTTPVGSYNIVPSAAQGSGLANYSINYSTNGTLTVTPALLGITANGTNRLYATANPVFTYTASGFVNGDTSSVLVGSPSLTTVAVSNSPVGMYAIVATNGTLVATNYSFAFTNGTLAVTLGVPVVTWPVPTNIVYGTPLGTNQNDATATVTGTNVYSPTNGVVLPVGTNTLTVVFTPTDTNYAGTNLSVLLVVTPAPLTVTASNASKTYGQTNPVLGVAISGVQNGDNITATNFTPATVGSPAGTYPIIPTLLDPNGRLVNYNVTTNNGTLTVTPALLGITANGTNRLYATANPVFTYTASGFVNGDTSSVLVGSPSLTTVAVSNSPVGTYAIVATNGTLVATNYSFAFTNGTLAVTLGVPLVTWPVPTNIVYGTPLGTNQNDATATVTGTNVYSPTNGVVLPVGTNTLTVVFTPTDTNYAGTNLSVLLVVTPAPLTVTASNASKTYGQTNPVLGVAISGVQNGDNITATNYTPATVGSPAGTYPIIPTLIDPNGRLVNYSVTTNNGTLTVTPALLGITANGTNRLYATANPVFTYTASGFVNGDTSSVLVGSPSLTTVAVSNSPVGTYAIVATNGTLVATNYSFAFTNGTLAVTLGVPVVTWPVPTNIVYGTPLGTNQNDATATVTGTNVYSPTNGVVLAAGTNTLTVVFTPTDTNYAGTNLSVLLVVTPAPLTVTASNASKTYGQTNPVLGVAISGVQNGDNITATNYTPATVGSPAGTYPIIPTLLDPNGRLVNYSVTTNNGTLTVTPALLGITANGTNRLYATANPVFTYTASGFVNGDTSSVLVGSPSLTTVAVSNSPVGTYAIVATNGTLVATNYSFAFTNGTLAVTLGVPVVTWPVPTNIVYGTPLGTNQNDATATVTGTNVYSPTNGVVLPVGTNTLTVVFTPTDTNYAGTNLSVLLVVTPAPLTLTAGPQSKAYGTALVLGTTNFTTSGLVNSDHVTGVTLTSSGSGVGATVGSYNIVASAATGTGLTNYTISYNNGTLTVSAAALSITAGPQSKAYGTVLVLGTTNFTASGLINSDTVTGVTLTSSGSGAGATVGSYNIVASAATGTGLTNYTISYNHGTLTITPALLGITANGTNRLYATANPVFTYTASGFVNGDTSSVLVGSPSLTTVAVSNSPVGTYAIVATNGTLVATNYSFAFTNGTLAVTLGVPVVTWPVPTNIVYGTPLGTNQNDATATVTGTNVYSPTNGVVLPVGTNTLTVVFTPTDTNYAGTNLSVLLVVTPAPLTITASNVSKIYGSTNPVLGVAISGVQNGDNITATNYTPATVGSPAGTYPIIPTLLDPNGRLVNYSVTTNNGTLTVTPALLGITANGTNRLYATANPVFTYTASGFVNGDTSSVLVGSPSLTTVAVSNSPVGTYAIVATNGTLVATNYSFAFTNGTLAVTLGVPVVTWPVPTNIVYGTPLGTNQNDATATVTGTNVYSPTNGVVLAAGTNKLTVVFTPTDTNYAGTNLSVLLVVTPAPLTVTASNQTKAFGQSLTLGMGQTAFKTSGLVNADSVTSVTLFSAGADSNAVSGPYPIIPSLAVGSGLSNYNITYSNGVLTVLSPAPTANAQSVTVAENTATPITLTGSPLPLTFAITGNPVHGTLSLLNTNTGTVTYTPNTNYSGADSFTFKVNNGQTNSAPATVSISVVPGAGADVQIVLSGPGFATVGDAFTFTNVVTNAGPATAVSTLVTNVLPANLVFASASGGGVFSNGVVTWPVLASLGNGQSTNLTVTVRTAPGSSAILPTANPFAFIVTNAAPANGSATNRASAFAATFDPDLTNNIASAFYTNAQSQTLIVPGVFSLFVATNTYPTNAVATNTIIPVAAGLFIAGTSAFNPQTQLYEEFVSVTNIGQAPVHALRLSIGNLRSGVTLYNATGTNHGVPYVEYDPPYAAPLNPGDAVSFTLEFFVADRHPFTNSLTATAILPPLVAPPGTTNTTAILKYGFNDNRNPGYPRFLVEFTSIPGRTYTIEYSDDDLATWNIALPSVVASTTTTFWYDDGPPATLSPPAYPNSSRFYRVILNP